MIKTFVKRMWLSIVLSIIIVLLGCLAYTKLEWGISTKTNRNTISISTACNTVVTPTMMNTFTEKIEKKLKAVKNVSYFESQSDQNRSDIELHLTEKANVADSIMDVRESVASVHKPEYVKYPVIRRSSKKNLPVIVARVHSNQRSLGEITEYAKTIIKGEVEKLSGVAYTEIYGASKPEIRIELIPHNLSYYNIDQSIVRHAFDAYNKERGMMERDTSITKFTVNAPATINNIKDIEDVIIDTERMIKIKNVAKVVIENKDLRRITWVNGPQQVLSFSVYQGSDGNPMVIADAVQKIMNKWKKKHNLTISFENNSTNTRIVRKKTIKSMIEALVLVILIILFFLGSAKSSFSPVLAIPISLIGTFFPMWLFGCTMNATTLSALLIAVGLVVDDAIVVVENIIEKYKKTKNWFQASIEGTEEIKVPIVVMTLTLAFVFFPVILSKGAFAASLKEFAITLCVSVIISGIVSLTLTPMLGARFISYSEFADRMFKPIENIYRSMLKFALQGRVIILALALTAIGTSVYLVQKIPKEHNPTVQKTSFNMSTVHGVKNKNMAYLEENARKLVTIIERYKKYIDEYTIILENRIYVEIDIKHEYAYKLEEIKKQMLAAIDQELKDIRFASGYKNKDLEFEIFLYGNIERSDLRKYGSRLYSALRSVPEIKNTIIIATREKMMTVTIDYNKASQLGIDANQLKQMTEFANSRWHISDIRLDSKKYKIVSLTDKQMSMSNDIMNHAWVINKRNGEKIHISPYLFTKIVKKKQDSSLLNYNGIPAFEMKIALHPNAKIGNAINGINKAKKQALGESVDLDYTGKAREFLEDQNEMFQLFLLAILFIFLILLAQFESIKNTIIVMSTAPLALSSSIIVLYFVGTINVYTTMALITLIGLITKHGILFINSATTLLNEGKEVNEAIFEGAVTRLKPVLMTTLAMALGVSPLLFETHPAMIGLKQIAIILFPGITMGTVMTLFVVPSLATLLLKKPKISIDQNIEKNL